MPPRRCCCWWLALPPAAAAAVPPPPPPPLLPSPHPTPAWWSEGLPLRRYRTTPDLPAEADIVVIGAGLTGASVVYHLTLVGDPPPGARSVLWLDARGVAEGATGRNVGGLGLWHGENDWEERVRRLGAAAAHRVAAFETAGVAYVAELRDALRADFALRGGTLQALASAAARGWAEGNCSAATADGERGVGPCEWWPPDRCGAALGRGPVPHGCIWYSEGMGAVAGAQVAVALARAAVASPRVNLQTQTAALRVDAAGAGGGAAEGWVVRTTRGAVRTRAVAHCTNAYVGGLLPPFRPRVAPFLLQALATAPVRRPHSPLAQWAEGDLWQPAENGSVVASGFLYRAGADDGVVDAGAAARLREWASEQLPQLRGAATAANWTGVVGESSDGLPWVGPLDADGLPGQYVAAGWGGGGQDQTLLAGRALAAMLSGRPADPALPPDLCPNRTGRRRLGV